MRSALLSLLIPVLFLAGCQAQSPADGHVTSNAYVNSYFRLSYQWPQILTPVDTSTLNLPHPASSTNEYLLFSARQGSEPYGIVIIAQKLGVATAHTSGIKDGADFLNRVTKSWGSAGGMKILKRTQATNSSGITFDQLDFLVNAGYASAITTQSGEYLMAFKCNAKSAADLDEMTKSILDSRRPN